MFQRTLQTLLYYYLVCVIAFEDILYAFGEETSDMTNRGRTQYQLLKERGSLPQYGECWKNAIRHVNDGCRHLSDNSQAEIALHLANCFLEMSGHETYKCELDKKPNLRGICIRSMSDRGFHVYTEFFTHTQNICFFLRGQIWHETISENTIKLGKQLEDSAENQENILRIQKESLELQESIKEFFEFLSEKQQDFDRLAISFKELQSWLLGELSWLDTFVFYFITTSITMFFTSLTRTFSARFLMLVILTVNVINERFITYIISRNITNIFLSRENNYTYVWLSRYITIILLSVILLYKFFTFKDQVFDNHALLIKIYESIAILTKKIEKIDQFSIQNGNNNISYISELSQNYKYDFLSYTNDKDLVESETPDSLESKSNKHDEVKVFAAYNSTKKSKLKREYLKPVSNFEMRYNLRNRSATPEVQKPV